MSIELFSFTFTFLGRLLPQAGALKTTAGGKGPILLVHGYVNTAWVWVFIKPRLAKAGFGPIYSINLGFPFYSIRTYAKRVAEKVKGIENLTLIGHSMGGIVSALYALELAPKNTVKDVILIGSPIEGTPLAWIALGKNGREMRPKSPLLKELREKISQNNDIRFYQIAALCDQLVIPGISAGRLVPLAHRLIIDNLGHTGLLFSSRVVDQITQWLLSRPQS